MYEMLLFIAAWLLMMALIGAICVGVGKLCRGKKNEGTNKDEQTPDMSE